MVVITGTLRIQRKKGTLSVAGYSSLRDILQVPLSDAPTGTTGRVTGVSSKLLNNIKKMTGTTGTTGTFNIKMRKIIINKKILLPPDELHGNDRVEKKTGSIVLKMPVVLVVVVVTYLLYYYIYRQALSFCLSFACRACRTLIKSSAYPCRASCPDRYLMESRRVSVPAAHAECP
jgi:hypothetical protein